MDNQEKNSAPEINRYSLVSPLQWMALGSGSTIVLLLSGFGAWTLGSQLLIERKNTVHNQVSLATSSQRLKLNLPNISKQQISSDVSLLPVFNTLKDREALVVVGDFQGNAIATSRTSDEVQKPSVNRAEEPDKPSTRNLTPQGNNPNRETPSNSSSGNNSPATTLISNGSSEEDTSTKLSSSTDSFDNISFDWGWDFSEGLAKVQVGESWGYIDRTGRMIIKPRFQDASYFAEDLASIKTDDKWGYIDRTGKVVIAPRFQEAKEFSEGFASVKFDGKWGYIDNVGNFAVQPQYEAAEAFHEGLASIKTGDKWGYIDPSGNVKIAPQFTKTWGFSQGMAQVKVGNRIAYIDKDGKFISRRP